MEHIPIAVADANGTQLSIQTVAGNQIKTHGQEFCEYLRDSTGKYVYTDDGARVPTQTVSGKSKRGPIVLVVEEDRLGAGTIVFVGAPSYVPNYLTISAGLY